MPTQQEIDKVCMQVAEAHSVFSKAQRAKVGAVLVTANGVMIPSWNGTPQGTDNLCEKTTQEGLVTLETVIHSELGTVIKAAKEGINVTGCTIYVTLQPCIRCSALLTQAGVKRIVYRDSYRDTSGTEFLKQNGIQVEQI